MKVIWTLFNQAAGKMAGIVAAHLPRGGNYVRERVIPKNPKSADQARVRAILASLSAAWTGTLTQVERDAWNALGGGGPTGTGQNLYVAGNSILLQCGGTRQDTAPTGSATATFTPPAEADVQISVGDTNVLVQGLNLTDDFQTDPNSVIAVYVSPHPQPEAHTANSAGLTFAGSAKTFSGPLSYLLVPLPGGQTAQADQVWFVRIVTATASGKKSADATYRVRTAATAPHPMEIRVDTGDFSWQVFWSRNVDLTGTLVADRLKIWGPDADTSHNADEATPFNPLFLTGVQNEPETNAGTANTATLAALSGLTYNGGTPVPTFPPFPITAI